MSDQDLEDLIKGASTLALKSSDETQKSGEKAAGKNESPVKNGLSQSKNTSPKTASRQSKDEFWKLTLEEKVEYKKVKEESEAKNIHFNEADNGSFSDFEGKTPSKCTLQGGVLNIFVVKKPEDFEPVEEDELKKLDQEFSALSSYQVSETRLRQLAGKYGFLSGKWIVFFDLGEDVDVMWQRLTRALLDGKMPGVVAMKVNSVDTSDANPHGSSQKISAITKDFTDTAELRSVERSLRAAGVKGRMMYKPDVYTRCNIFSKNEFGIKPSILNSYPVGSGRGRGRRY